LRNVWSSNLWILESTHQSGVYISYVNIKVYFERQRERVRERERESESKKKSCCANLLILESTHLNGVCISYVKGINLYLYESILALH
jgi:hypothetical protein